MRQAITLFFSDQKRIEETRIMAPTQEAQKELEGLATRIRRFLDRPHFRGRLARLLVFLAEMILLRLEFTPRRSLLLDRLTQWAGK